jgi:hypothetical protein
MATLLQLQSEPWWGHEVVTTELDWLGDEMCRRTGQPRTAAGSKGNTSHLRGAHRSQEWILNSAFCTSRTYTVQSGLSGTQARHVAGFDFVPGAWGTSENRRRMVEQTSRLLAAMRAGELDEVRELFGTVDGRTVAGWNNVTNRAATSDSSHLDHWHLTIDRRQLRNRDLMERIVATALGDVADIEEEEDVARLTFFKADGKLWRSTEAKSSIRQIDEAVYAQIANRGDNFPDDNGAPPSTDLLADGWTWEQIKAAYGEDEALLVGGAVPGPTADEIRAIVDDELDQAFTAAADE